MRRLAAFAATAIALAVSPSAHAQCAPVDPLPNPSVGRVDGTRAFLGVSWTASGCAPTCGDGTANRNATISQWFNGRWDGSRPLRLRAGGHLLQITSRRAGGVIRGACSHAFGLRPVSGSAGGVVIERRYHRRIARAVRSLALEDDAR